MRARKKPTSVVWGAPGTSRECWPRVFFDYRKEKRSYPYSVQLDLAILRAALRRRAHIAKPGTFFNIFKVVHRDLEIGGAFTIGSGILPPSPLSVIGRFKRLLKINLSEYTNITSHSACDRPFIQQIYQLIRVCKSGTSPPAPFTRELTAAPSQSSSDLPSSPAHLSAEECEPTYQDHVSDSDGFSDVHSNDEYHPDSESVDVKEESQDFRGDSQHPSKRQKVRHVHDDQHESSVTPRILSVPDVHKELEPWVCDNDVSPQHGSGQRKSPTRSSTDAELEFRRLEVEEERNRFYYELQKLRLENKRISLQMNFESRERRRSMLRRELVHLRNAYADALSLLLEL